MNRRLTAVGVIAAVTGMVSCLVMSLRVGLDEKTSEPDWLEISSQQSSDDAGEGRTWECVLSNVSGSDLAMLRVQGSCSCFQVALDRSALPRRGSIRLIVRRPAATSLGDGARVVSIILRSAEGRLRQEALVLTEAGVEKSTAR